MSQELSFDFLEQFKEQSLALRLLRSPHFALLASFLHRTFLANNRRAIPYQELIDLLERGNTMSLFMRPDREKGKPFQGFTDGQKINRQEFKRLVEDPKYKRAIYMHLLRQIRSGYAFQLEREATSRLIAAGGEEKALVGVSDDGLEA